MGDTLKGERPNSTDKSSILVNILEKCMRGATKQDIMTSTRPIPLSHAQLRRATAELVDKRLLSYDERRHVFLTTDKGILFLKKAKKTPQIRS